MAYLIVSRTLTMGWTTLMFASLTLDYGADVTMISVYLLALLLAAAPGTGDIAFTYFVGEAAMILIDMIIQLIG